MRQEWNDLAFVHWPVPVECVQDRLPSGLYADLHDGHAWVGLVAFHMERIGAGGLHVPYLGTFPETNIRTYVRDAVGRPGVWFDSLDITRAIPTAVARVTYGLPYMWSKMQIRRRDERRVYECRRRWGGPPASSLIDVEIGQAIDTAAVTPLERFLTCRWGLYSRSLGRVLYAPVEHPEWPLHRARPARARRHAQHRGRLPPARRRAAGALDAGCRGPHRATATGGVGRATCPGAQSRLRPRDLTEVPRERTSQRIRQRRATRRRVRRRSGAAAVPPSRSGG